MPPYLLKRRLRHVRSIRIDNVSAPVDKNPGAQRIPFEASFIVLETLKGEPLYVSEVQSGFMHNIQFNELPHLEDPINHIVLKIAVKFPSRTGLSSYVNEDSWLALRVYEVDLNKLQSINPDDLIDSYNAPLFEMTDGFYTLPGLPAARMVSNFSSHKRNVSNSRFVQSFSFNSALKLNKLIEYKTQVMIECSKSAAKVEEIILSNNRRELWQIKCIARYNDELKRSMQEKTVNISRLDEKIRPILKLNENEQIDGQSLNDYYGNTYPNLIQTKDRVDFLRIKRLSKLIGVFKETCLFRKDVRFISIDEDTSSRSLYERTSLNLIDKKRIIEMASTNDAERELVNTCLGYYLIFIKLVATKVYEIPLPYSISYYGSTSLIGGDGALYLSDSAALKNPENFLNAMDKFNKNLIQIIQRWGHHRSP